MAGVVEIDEVPIAELTEESGDGDSGGADRVGEVLVGESDDESVTLGSGVGEVTFEELQEFEETVFDATVAGDGAEGFALLEASDHLPEEAFHEFWRLLDFTPGNTHGVYFVDGGGAVGLE